MILFVQVQQNNVRINGVIEMVLGRVDGTTGEERERERVQQTPRLSTHGLLMNAKEFKNRFVSFRLGVCMNLVFLVIFY